MANEDQKEAWNGAVGEKWADRQDRMDRMLAPLSAVALDRAHPKAHERVLDIGCGCGDTSIAMAANAEQVVGYDLSAPMLAVARARAAGFANASFVEADASSVPLDGDADLLFSRFGVMFFDDPVGAFRHLRGGLKPGGRACMLVWRALMDNEWMARPLGAAMSFLGSRGSPDPRAPGPFAFADRDYVTSILDDAGFVDIGFEVLDRLLVMGASVDEAMAEFGEMGPLARLLREADEREHALAAVRSVMAEHVVEDGTVRMGASCWIVTASSE